MTQTTKTMMMTTTKTNTLSLLLINKFIEKKRIFELRSMLFNFICCNMFTTFLTSLKKWKLVTQHLCTSLIHCCILLYLVVLFSNDGRRSYDNIYFLSSIHVATVFCSLFFQNTTEIMLTGTVLFCVHFWTCFLYPPILTLS